MKKLHQLAKELYENNYVMTDKMKEQFEEFLSIIANGARVLHSVFGLGTVIGTQGNTRVMVKFDIDIEKQNSSKGKDRGWWCPDWRAVNVTSCTSIHMLIKRETERANKEKSND